MKYKIVFFDVDGTLIDKEKQISKSTIQAIDKLRNKCIKVVCATGRSPIHIKDVLDVLNLDSYICFNGSLISYKGKKIFNENIDHKDLAQLVVESKERKKPLIYFTENGCYSNVQVNEQIKASFEFLMEKLPNVNPDIWYKENIFQVYLFCNDVEQVIYEKNHPNLRFTRWHPNTVDVNKKQINKSLGIKKLLKYLKIEPEEAIAFGDNLNDLEMLSYVGMGVAMGNAIDETKRKADFVTKPINEGGISYALKMLKVI